MDQVNGSAVEQASYIVAQARLDARTDHRTGGQLMYSIYANLRERGNLSGADWKIYQNAYEAEQQRMQALESGRLTGTT